MHPEFERISWRLVSLGTRLATVLAVVPLAVLPVSCGGGEKEMRAALTDDGCTYEGTTTPAAPMFTVTVENQTAHFGAFALATLAAGSTIDDLEPWLEQAREQYDRSGTLPTLPPFYEQVVRSGVEAGASGLLPADVSSGRYALMCFVDDLSTWRVYAAAQLDVTG
jgi:hypothetical protein